MITREEIQKAISDAVAPHNKLAEEHNAKAYLNNRNKRYNDPGYMHSVSEINEYDPRHLFEENDLDFGDFTFKKEEEFGGEGKGDTCWEVYLVTKQTTGDTAYIKFDGWYSSEEGSHYDNPFQLVEPYEKKVRDWKKVK